MQSLGCYIACESAQAITESETIMNPPLPEFDAVDVRGGETGVGLRWVLGASLLSMIMAAIAVTTLNIAG